jgi:glutamyl-tRNA synthetase
MDTSIPPVRVRFAPSPTGRTHLGSARTALYNFLLARQTGGQFILRFEDTDQKRFVPGAEEELVKSLQWLGLEWDEGPDLGGPFAPYRQSERKDIYLSYARELIESDHAFYCFCTPERLELVRKEQIKFKQQLRYDGTCRRINALEVKARVRSGEPHVIRFKMPLEGTISIKDRLRGDITFENRNLDDYVLVKSAGLALYHLAAMVDDHLMEITHVIRSSEWLSTLPLHEHIIRALGWEAPEWVHLSVFLKPSGKGKMSKRESSAVMRDGYSIFVGDLEELGYIPEAVVNWIALMGWSYDDRTEFFTLEDLIRKFSLDKCNPSPAAINFKKLDHFNGVHIRKLDNQDLMKRVAPFFENAGFLVNEKVLIQIIPLIRERMTTLDDAPRIAGFFFKDIVEPVPEDLIGKKMTASESATAARLSYQILAEIPVITHQSAEEKLRSLADSLGIKAGQLFGILRVAVTGQKVSTPLLESMEIIGKDKVLERIQNAIIILDELAHINSN